MTVGIRWAFEQGPFGEWYPLAPLSHMLDCQLFGLAPWGHHLTNLLLHAATSIGLFLVLRGMTGQRAVPEVAQVSGVRVASAGPSATTLWPSAFVAAMFAVHPLHVESVAWVAERRDVLSGLFFVLTLAAYAGYVRPRPIAGPLLPGGRAVRPGADGQSDAGDRAGASARCWIFGRWVGWVGRAAEAVDHRSRPGNFHLGCWKSCRWWLALAHRRLPGHPCEATSSGLTRPWSMRIGNAAVLVRDLHCSVLLPGRSDRLLSHCPREDPAGEVPGAVAMLATIWSLAVLWRRPLPIFFRRLVLVFGHADAGDWHWFRLPTMRWPIAICICPALGYRSSSSGESPGERPTAIRPPVARGGAAPLIGLYGAMVARQGN